MKAVWAALVVSVVALAGCGDDASTTTVAGSTTSSSTQPTTTPTITDTASTTTSSTTTPPEQPTDLPAASPEDAARAVLTAAGDPKQACDAYVTTAFLQISYGGRQNCLASRTPNALAESIEVRSSKETASGVHLVVVPKGGPYDGAKVEVEVIPDGDGFRVDSLQAHVPAGP